MQPLTHDDTALLDFLTAQPSLASHAVNPKLCHRFGNLTRTWQHINALLDHDEALAYAPAAVARLRRIRDSQARIRAHTRHAA